MQPQGLKGIDIRSADAVKMVEKPWGWEKWLAHGKPEFPYAFKMIHVRAPHKTSLQFHRYKQESNYLLKGKAVLYYAEKPVDIERYRNLIVRCFEIAASSLPSRPDSSGV